MTTYYVTTFVLRICTSIIWLQNRCVDFVVQREVNKENTNDEHMECSHSGIRSQHGLLLKSGPNQPNNGTPPLVRPCVSLLVWLSDPCCAASQCRIAELRLTAGDHHRGSTLRHGGSSRPLATLEELPRWLRGRSGAHATPTLVSVLTTVVLDSNGATLLPNSDACGQLDGEEGDRLQVWMARGEVWWGSWVTCSINKSGGCSSPPLVRHASTAMLTAESLELPCMLL
jgi:hypothetical protein